MRFTLLCVFDNLSVAVCPLPLTSNSHFPQCGLSLVESKSRAALCIHSLFRLSGITDLERPVTITRSFQIPLPTSLTADSLQDRGCLSTTYLLIDCLRLLACLELSFCRPMLMVNSECVVSSFLLHGIWKAASQMFGMSERLVFMIQYLNSKWMTWYICWSVCNQWTLWYPIR